MTPLGSRPGRTDECHPDQDAVAAVAQEAADPTAIWALCAAVGSRGGSRAAGSKTGRPVRRASYLRAAYDKCGPDEGATRRGSGSRSTLAATGTEAGLSLAEVMTARAGVCATSPVPLLCRLTIDGRPRLMAVLFAITFRCYMLSWVTSGEADSPGLSVPTLASSRAVWTVSTSSFQDLPNLSTPSRSSTSVTSSKFTPTAAS